jgi:hypothetical protein
MGFPLEKAKVIPNSHKPPEYLRSKLVTPFKIKDLLSTKNFSPGL